ncbi:hypothetical protein ACP70R_018896 [Stipagrostis hirtigluma subsp. patula]
MEAHRGVETSGTAAGGGAQTAAGEPVPLLFRPLPRLPAPPPGSPRRPPRYGVDGLHRGGAARSGVEKSILVHEMLDPTSAIDGPLFSGPPPERPGNPVINDPLFGKALPTAGLVATTRCPRSAWAMACGSNCFCGAPAVVLMEGFCCRRQDRRRRRVATSSIG